MFNLNPKDLIYCKVSPPENTQDTFRLNRKSISSWQQCGKLDPHHKVLIITVLVFYAQKPHPSRHTSVGKKQTYRKQKTNLLHLGAFLDPGTVDQVCDGLGLCSPFGRCGAYILGFQVRMVPLTWHQLC